MTAFATLVMAADTRGLKQGVTTLDDVVKAGGRAEKSTDKVTKSFDRVNGIAIKAAKALGALAAGYASIATIGSSINMARDFNAALAETSTLIEGTPAQMKELSDAARTLSTTYGGDATTQVQAFYQALSAGAGSVGEATTILDQANKLAIGGATDVTTGVDGLTTAMNAFAGVGLTAAQASDAMFVAMRAGKTTIGELSASLGQIVPIASSAGVSFDEVVGGIAALTTQGLSTSSATTGLRQVIASVIAPTKQATDAAKSLGIAFDVQSLKSKGLAGFLDEVITKTGGNEAAMAKLFGSVEALGAVLAFAGGAGGSFSDIMADMETKAGATDAAFEKMAQSLDQRWARATAAARDLLLAFGNVALAVVVPAMEAAVAAIGFVANNMDILAVAVGALAATQLPALVLALGAKAAALATATAAYGVGAAAAAAYAAAARGAAVALALMGGPLGLVAGLLTAAAGAAIIFGRDMDTTKGAMSGAQEAASVLGTELAILAGNDLPKTSQATIQLANDNLSLAKSAYAAAEAQIALRQANLQAGFDQMSMENAFLPGVENPAQAEYAQRIQEAIQAGNELRAAEAELNKRIFEGNQIKRSAAEELENITVTVRGTEAALNGLGASGAGAAKSVKKGIDEAAKALKEAEKAARDAERAHEQWANNAAGHFDGLISGGKSFSDVLKSIARQLESSAWQQLFGGMGGGGGGGNFFTKALGFLSGGGGGGSGVVVPQNVLAAAASFSGGGYTGSGPRSGGLDGQGGFMAMMHPRETVIDHTRGQVGGAPAVNVSFNIDARGSVEGEAHRLGAYMRQAAPDIERRVISAIQNKRSRGHAV